MENWVNSRVEQLKIARQRERRRQIVIGCLAILVVLCTAYVLSMPAITMERDAICGLDEHVHTEACYTEVPALICGLDEQPGHIHSEECFSPEGELVCEQPESEGHTHDESCYSSDFVLTCGLQEHMHTEACYAESAEDAEEFADFTVGTSEEEPTDFTVDMNEEEPADEFAMDAESEAELEIETEEEPADESAMDAEPEAAGEEEPADETAADAELEEKSETEKEEEEPVSMPAQSFFGKTEEVAVFVEADEGTFPAGTYMTVEPVVDETILNAAAGTVASEVSSLCAVDICFFNSQGEEIQPMLPIRVTMATAAVMVPENTVVVHVDDAGAASQVENVETGEENVSFEADSFSVYVIVGTVIEKTVLASDGQNYTVTATYGAETGIPAEADLTVEEILPDENDDAGTFSVYEEYVSKTENALGMEGGSAGYIRLFDIKIVDKYDHSVKYQPTEGTKVDVKISLADKDSSEEAAASTQVVHFQNEQMDGTVIGNSTDGQIVAFEADGFSIYAIVDSSKRLKYNFYNGTSLLVSEYIKKQDNVLQELYDPGVEPEYGQTFSGWAYAPDETNPSNIYTIEELNQQAAARYNSATEELTEVNVYAIYDEAWYLRYMDQDAQGNATVLNVVRVRKDAADKNVTIEYTFTPEEGIVFEGWIDVATGQTYHYGDTITLDHHVDLYVKLQGRNWLVFDANAGGPGSGATYTPPQLLIGEATTSRPDDPTRRGYTFTGWNTKADGTGTWWYKPDGSVNQFGNTLSSDTTLYAQWEADDTDYYVVFWKQRATDAAGLADDAKTYDYVSSEHRTAKTGQTVSITAADQQKGGTAYSEYGYYFTYNGNNSDVTATVDANGTTVLNVYYDRREITYNFTSDSDFTVTGYTGVVDGQTVVLTPDGKGGYTYQKEHTETVNMPYTGQRYDVSNNDYDDNPVKYGVYNGNVVRLYYNDGTWYRTRTGIIWYRYSNPYSGTRYIQSNTGAYGWINNTMTLLNADGTYTTTISVTTTEPYTGEVSISTVQTRSASFTGLYGSAFSNWPDPGANSVWTVTYNGRTLSLPLALTLFDPQAALDPNATQTTVNFTASNYSTGNTMTIYVQDTNGEWGYSDDYILTTANLGSNGTWYPTETFEGFTLHSYQVSRTLNPNGPWTSITPDGNFYYDNNVFLRYSRNQHNIHFISQGPHVTQREEQIIEGVYYDSDLNKYAHNGSAYYEPTNGIDGYYFAGWYSDPDCQIPFDFDTTMPDNDITVYAKWDTYRVRVVLVPTPNNEHNDEVQLANNQSLSFRLDYNEQVDGTNIDSSAAKRPGYKLIGWYYTPDFDPATEVHFPVLINNNTPGVDMNYQSGEDWDKYGDNDGSHDNVRGILKLYAKWELDVDVNSVYVEYDVDDVYRTYDTAGMLQTTIPVDDHKYALTNNNVTFQVAEAPTAYTSGFEFYRWVLLNPDGSESEIMYNPADTAAEVPSSFIYEETITDDLGNTATIKKIRLKAKFNIETEKVTTVTFDGNGGVTNDSAQQESVTESYPINKDFTMKGKDSFVREGYTLIGWAFQRENGSKITVEDYKNAIETMTPDELIQAGIYQLGQEVAADNLEVSGENNWDPLENTVYAVWEINKYTVTVKKLVDGDAGEDRFSFQATSSGDYILPEASFELPHNGTKTIEDVPYGTVLTFTETPVSGYSIQRVDARQTSLPDKTQLEESAYIDLGGEDGKAYTIKGDTVITYTNEKAKAQKLRIKKIGNDAAGADGLAGATFSLTATGVDGFNNMTNIVSMDGTNLGYLRGNDDTDETLFVLPAGDYTLTEKTPPAYYDGLSGSVTLTVAANGISIGNDNDTVALVGPDENGVYTLTVTNIRKLATVTIVKEVKGVTTDQNIGFDFSATGLTEESDAFTLYGTAKAEQGEEPEHLHTKVYTEIPYGTVFSVKETTADPNFATSIGISNNGETTTINGAETGSITVNGDVTVTYTNTRDKIPVKVIKTDQSVNALAGATFEGTLIDNGSVTTTVADEEAVILDKSVELGSYTITETRAPDGYYPLEGPVKISVESTEPAGDIVVTAKINGKTSAFATAERVNISSPELGWIVTIKNDAGVALPNTGGSGTNLLYLLGGMLILLAGAALLIDRKRMKM